MSALLEAVRYESWALHALVWLPIVGMVMVLASAEERAKRRYKQLKDKGLNVTLASLLREIEARDARDAARPVAPLKPATDAVLIDSTGMPVDAVVEQVLSLIQST